MTPAAHRSARPSARGLVLLVWAFAFFAFAGTTLLNLDPVARAGGVLLFGLPVVVWAVLGWRRRVDRLDVAVLLGVAAHLVVSLASLDPTASLEMSAAVVAYAAVYGVARGAAGDAVVRRVLTTAIVAALVFWLVVLALTWIGEKVVAVQQLGWPVPLDAHQPWVWGSVNTPPVLTLLAVPFIAWLADTRVRTVATAIWLLTAVVVLPFSQGRAAWLGLAVAAIAVDVLHGFPALRRLRLPAQRAARLGMVGSAAAVVTLAALFAAGRLDTVTAQLNSRVRLWDQAMSLFSADPLTGAGPSTFGWARLSHVPDYVDRVGARDVHSVPFQTLADGGLLLLAASLAIALAWVSLLVERRHALDGRQRIAVAAIIGYATFALLDDLSFIPAIPVLLIVLAAWAIPSASATPSTGRTTPAWAVPLVLVLASVATVPSVVAMTGARLEAAAGRNAAVRGDWPAALDAFERAAARQPESALHWMSVGLAAAVGGQAERAGGAYERALELNPGDARPWGALAALEPDDATAAQLLHNATRRSNDPRYAYRLAEAQLRAGDPDGAAASFAIAVTLWQDWWAVVPEMLRTEVRRALPEAMGTVGSVADRNPREALWTAGLLFGDLPSDAPSAWQAVHLASRGDLAAASAELDRSPPSARTDQAAAAVAMLACDRAAYERATERLAHRPAESQRGDHPVQVGRSGLYRDFELGDYQPIRGRSVPEAPPWPLGLIEVPDCGW